ncbi:hypothetical protein C2E23DRAFT_579897 [Lenzites betulinus]|nr:hypothetical protein C2E23DRAFT_579897 [Lenzites betulinus]
MERDERERGQDVWTSDLTQARAGSVHPGRRPPPGTASPVRPPSPWLRLLPKKNSVLASPSKPGGGSARRHYWQSSGATMRARGTRADV